MNSYLLVGVIVVSLLAIVVVLAKRCGKRAEQVRLLEHANKAFKQDQEVRVNMSQRTLDDKRKRMREKLDRAKLSATK